MFIWNLIIWGILLTILLLEKECNIEKFLTTIIVAYCCCPFLKIGTIEINGSYILTTLVFVCIITNVFNKAYRLSKWHKGFVLVMSINMILMLIAGLINGKINIGTFATMIGFCNIWLGTICFSVLLQNTDKIKIFLTAIWKINWIHTILGLIQLIYVNAGVNITGQIFSDSNRMGPLLTMREIGGFNRIFGATYSPTILGVYILMASSFILACILKTKRNKQCYFLLAHTLFLGLFAFSKTVIVGIFLIVGFSIILMFIYKKKYIVMTAVKILGVVLSCFILVIILCYPTRLKGQVNYYFGTILSSPTQALESRYGNTDEETESGGTEKGLVQEENLKTIDYFYRHPILGVGMSQVGTEFIGDSQYLAVLHHEGLFGAFVYIAFYGSLFYVSFIRKKIDIMQLLFSVALCGLATNVLETNVGIPFLAYCLTVEGSE